MITGQEYVKNDSGFTLIETLVAVFILTVGVFGLYSMQITAIDGNAKAARITYGTGWATDQIENLIGKPYDDPVFNDDDGDGTGQDGDGDGIDDGGDDFGLNDVGAQADGSMASPDGRYTVFWNIADQQRMPDLKSIRIIVQYQDKGNLRSIVMDYIKPSM